MTTEQKEGIVMVVLTMCLAGIFLLLTTWYGGHVPATVWLFKGIERSCVGERDCGTVGYTTDYAISFELFTGLVFLLPILAYGILRSLGIIKRVFKFEERLFKFLF